MTNELLLLGTGIVTFSLVLAGMRAFGDAGLFAWIALATVIANIQVTKTVEIFGLTATLGNMAYASAFLATDILSETRGRREASRAVWVGFWAVGSFLMLITLTRAFVPAPSDIAHGHLDALFALLPRIAGASLIAYLVSQLHDVWLYDTLRRRVPGPLWVRNNVSTMVSQLIDTVLFVALAFVGVYPVAVLLEIAVTTYLFKLLAAALDTPFVYAARRIAR